MECFEVSVTFARQRKTLTNKNSKCIKNPFKKNDPHYYGTLYKPIYRVRHWADQSSTKAKESINMSAHNEEAEEQKKYVRGC